MRSGGAAQELDPLGGDAGTHAQTQIPDEGALVPYGRSYNAANPNITYTVDGIRVPADDFMAFAGVAVQDPLSLLEWFARNVKPDVHLKWYRGIPDLSLLPQLNLLPQSSAIAKAIAKSDARVDAKYTDCAKLLGGSPAPSVAATKSILSTTILEGGSATLLAVTWAAESGFDFGPDSNPNNGAANNADIGPMQINYRTFHDWEPLDDLGDVFGTTTTGKHRFDGNPYDNLRAGARILNSYGQGRNAAGLYRTGTGDFARTRVGRAAFNARVGQYDQWAGEYNAFFNCLRS